MTILEDELEAQARAFEDETTRDVLVEPWTASEPLPPVPPAAEIILPAASSKDPELC
ncbi:MAG: hypothetical protein Q8O67_09645 [Deltaproteobacteria bacterium]|nr:hypothetical protein [Deltaproteobacteria bacterium]